MKLVILESPTKTKTVSQYLGDDYQVLSSNGHVTKLALTGKYNLGIDLINFEPSFIVDDQKKTLLKKFKTIAKKADEIYLATDPDREGEAIAYHLIQQIVPKKIKVKRIILNEITRKAVLQSIKTPTKLDQNLVESQITRRLLDRMMGFRLSRLLQQKIAKRSAGRVQSVALKLILERESERKAFKSEKFWFVFGKVQNQYQLSLTKAKVKNSNDKVIIKNKKIIFKQEKDFKFWLENLNEELLIKDILNKKEIVNPPKPLTTARLIQLASSKLNFSIKQTMFLAQKLYEGVQVDDEIVGLISYPRTDSQRLNDDFILKTKEFLLEKFTNKNVDLSTLKIKKNKKTANDDVKIQDAHEAIRITWQLSIEQAEKILESKLYRLYKLIYDYTLASLMKPAELKSTIFVLENNHYQFELISNQVEVLGFTKILDDALRLKLMNFDNQTSHLPNWKINDKIVVDDFIFTTKTTKPKTSLTEGKLIKLLESSGIGRPSTYHSIVSKLIDNNYLIKEDQKLLPTESGAEVIKNLEKYFSEFIEKKYTAKLEVDLDQIANGDKKRFDFLKLFWNQLEQKIIGAKEMSIEKQCPECQKELIVKRGKYGTFIACSGYPECRYIEKKVAQSVKIDRNCPECQKSLLERVGKFGKFIACSGYPECRYVEKTKPQSKEILEETCPNCQANLVVKIGRFGKFTACSNYPECKTIIKK